MTVTSHSPVPRRDLWDHLCGARECRPGSRRGFLCRWSSEPYTGISLISRDFYINSTPRPPGLNPTRDFGYYLWDYFLSFLFYCVRTPAPSHFHLVSVTTLLRSDPYLTVPPFDSCGAHRSSVVCGPLPCRPGGCLGGSPGWDGPESEG